MLDVLDATLLYKSRNEIEAALPVITKQIEAAGGTVVRVKDRFARPSAGYKDYLINIRMKNGFVTELLLTTKAMSEAKQGKTGIGHDIYEAIQYEAIQEVAGILNRAELSESQLEESEETLAQIASRIEEAGSLRKYAASGAGSDPANALVADGVISQTEHSKLTGRTGKLNDAGKDLLERALRGLAVPHYDVLSALPKNWATSWIALWASDANSNQLFGLQAAKP